MHRHVSSHPYCLLTWCTFVHKSMSRRFLLSAYTELEIWPPQVPTLSLSQAPPLSTSSFPIRPPRRRKEIPIVVSQSVTRDNTEGLPYLLLSFHTFSWFSSLKRALGGIICPPPLLCTSAVSTKFSGSIFCRQVHLISFGSLFPSALLEGHRP